jgi:hypothetical protein
MIFHLQDSDTLHEAGADFSAGITAQNGTGSPFPVDDYCRPGAELRSASGFFT